MRIVRHCCLLVVCLVIVSVRPVRASDHWTSANDPFGSHLIISPTGVAPAHGQHRISIGTQGLPNYEVSLVPEHLHLQVQSLLTAFFHVSAFWTAVSTSNLRVVPVLSYGASPYMFSFGFLTGGVHIPLLFDFNGHEALFSLQARTMTMGNFAASLPGDKPFVSDRSQLMFDVGIVLPVSARYALVGETAFLMSYGNNYQYLPLAAGGRFSKGNFGVQFGLLIPDLLDINSTIFALPWLELAWQFTLPTASD